MNLIIFGIIMFVILIILFSPVKVYIKYVDEKPEVILKYLFLKFVPSGKKEKKKLQNKKKETKKNSEVKKSEVQKKKNAFIPQTTSGKIEFAQKVLKTTGKLFRRLTKHIKIRDIYIDIQISELDAYECAIKFGKTNIIVYNLLGLLGNFVTLKKKKINIKCVYNQSESIYNISFNIRIALVSLLFIATAFIYRFFLICYKERENEETEEKKHLNNQNISQDNQECQTT